jgi:hypothetical protein
MRRALHIVPESAVVLASTASSTARVRSNVTAAIVLAAAIFGPACASHRPRVENSAIESAAPAPTVHAQCLVCKHEGDLACVDVKVRADTPRTEYGGRTYYFCSEQCRKQFEAAPMRYIE